MKIKIPYADWHLALADAIEDAQEATTIVVASDAARELGISAAKRMGKADLISWEIEA